MSSKEKETTTTAPVTEEKVKAFQCMRTGLYFPADYVEQWGKKYGRGMGKVPVSEALVNNYDRPIAENKSGRLNHSISVCKAPVQMVEITKSEYEAKKAILHIDDPRYDKRGPIMRERQDAHYKADDKTGIHPAIQKRLSKG